MTYQIARGARPTYIGIGDRKSYNNVAASANRGTRRRATVSPEMRREREEQMRRAQAMRARAEREEAYRIARMEHERARQERELARIKAYEKRVRQEQKRAKTEARREERLAARREEDALRRREIKVERRRAPMGIILGIVIAFVLLMGVVYSFSQISESSAQLSEMKTQLTRINAEASKYALEIEEKNDLGVIENLAVNELNMVKEGSVQKKYITVSEGDRIVIAEDVSDEAPESYGGILSGLSAAFDDILDYIR